MRFCIDVYYIDAGFHSQSTFVVQRRDAMFVYIGHAITWAQLCRRYRSPHGGDPYGLHLPVDRLDWKLTRKQRSSVVDGIYVVSEHQARTWAEFTINDGAGGLFFSCEESAGGFFELVGSDDRQGAKDGAEFTPEFIVGVCADFTEIGGPALEVDVEDFYGHSPDDEDWTFKDDPEKRRAIVRAFIELWPQLARGKPMPKLKICGKRIRYGAYPKHPW